MIIQTSFHLCIIGCSIVYVSIVGKFIMKTSEFVVYFCEVCITHIIIVWCKCICTYVQYQHFSFYNSVE